MICGLSTRAACNVPKCLQSVDSYQPFINVMTYPKTSVPLGHEPCSSWNAWNGTGRVGVPPAHDAYAARAQLGPHKDQFLGGRLDAGPPVKTLPPILGQPAGLPLLAKIVARGSSGDDVGRLQQLLNGRLDPSPGLTETGQFDDKTRDALTAFQRASGITPDGKVERKTWYKLLYGGRVRWPDQAAGRQSIEAAPSEKHPVAAWLLEDKFEVVLVLTRYQFSADLRFTFEQMMNRAMRKTLSVILATWATTRVTNGTESIDLGLFGLSMGLIDVADLDVIDDLNSCLINTANASKLIHLDHASTYLARVLTRLGVTLFVALVHRIVTRYDLPVERAAPQPEAGSAAKAGKAVDMKWSDATPPAPAKPAPAKPVSQKAAALAAAREKESPFCEVCGQTPPPAKPATEKAAALANARSEAAPFCEVCNQ